MPDENQAPRRQSRGLATLRTGAVISLVITAVAGLTVYGSNRYVWIGDQTGYSPRQPIEFSHKTHAKDYSISCEYCHFSARHGPVAGIPPAAVCMNCHAEVAKDSQEIKKVAAARRRSEPIEWVRVHDLPDFVHFDHSAHVAKGVACQECHGRVEEMARIEQARHFNMGWCVDCHRRQMLKAEKGRELVRALAECSTCHF